VITNLENIFLQCNSNQLIVSMIESFMIELIETMQLCIISNRVVKV